MTQKHILSLLVSAALLCGLLAGCSNTNGDASPASSSASEPSSVSSESAPSSTAQEIGRASCRERVLPPV